jgi:hypothetical protein
MATPLKFYDVAKKESFVTADWYQERATNGRLMAVAKRGGRKIVRFIG